MRSSAGASVPKDRRLAVAELTDAHLDAAYRLATFILEGDQVEAEDVVQDAALRAWARAESLRDLDHFEPWFMRIVVNAARDHRRRGRVRPLSAGTELATATPDPGEEVALSDALDQALRMLTPEQRVVIGLRYLSDYTLEQIASTTGKRLGTVKSRLHYGLRALRAAVDSEARDGNR